MKRINSKLSFIRPKAILFDTDNTLYDYSPANVFAEEAVCDKARNLLGIERKKFFEYYKLARSEVKANLGNTASSHSRLLYFQRMIELLGFKSKLLLALDFEQTFWRNFLVNSVLFPGVKETLAFFKNERIPIAVVTDLNAHIQMRKLTYFGLEDTFDAVVTSEEVGVDKPNKKNFTFVLNKLNLSEKSFFWMIGDNPKADIFGAKNLGALTFQKIHHNVKIGKSVYEPDYLFHDYYSFLKEIKKILINKNFD